MSYLIIGENRNQAGMNGLGDMEAEKVAGRAFIWNITAASRAKFQYGDRIHKDDVDSIFQAIAAYEAGRSGFEVPYFIQGAWDTFWEWICPNNQSEWFKNNGYRTNGGLLDRAGDHIGEVIWQVMGQPGYVSPEAAKALARRMFSRWLRRPIDEGQELENWKVAIVTNRLTEADVKAMLVSSQEFKNMLASKIYPFLTKAFKDLLGRNPNPDPTVELYPQAMSVMENNWDEAGYRNALWGVPECLASMTSRFYKVWIIKAFNNLLGRAPSAGDIEGQAASIHTNHWTEAQYRDALSQVAEAVAYKAAQEAAAAAVAAKEAAAAEAARKAAEEAAKKKTTEASAFNLDFLKSPWIWVAFALGGGLYYWTQVKHQSMGQIPYVGQYLGGKRRGRR